MQLKGLRAINRGLVPVAGPSVPLQALGSPQLDAHLNCLIVGHSPQVLIA